jgi:hypothetical protein
MKELANIEIAYWPCSYNLDRPGDRRRFYYYASKKNVRYELFDVKKNYDLVILSQNADITILDSLKSKGTKVIYDCIDSYISDKFSWKDLFRGCAKYLVGENKYLNLNYSLAIKKILSSADGVICASPEQFIEISKYSNNVHYISDMPNNENMHIKNNYKFGKEINIVWEGLGSNVYQLQFLKKTLREFLKKKKFILHVITDPYYFKHMLRFGKRSTEAEIKNISESVVFHSWEKESYSQQITNCDFAIIPIDKKNKLALGKPENKLIMLWRMGMPTITDSTKSYDRVMRDSGIEMSCNNYEDWLMQLELLSGNESYRKNIAEKAKKYVLENYSDDLILKKWDSLFRSIL